MTYKLNGTEIPQPTTGRWLPIPVLGKTGRGYPIYPQVAQFELRWNLSSVPDADQVRDFWTSVSLTGSVVVDLPRWNGSTYAFYSYTGCSLYRPEWNAYFSEHITDIVMIVGNIVP